MLHHHVVQLDYIIRPALGSQRSGLDPEPLLSHRDIRWHFGGQGDKVGTYEGQSSVFGLLSSPASQLIQTGKNLSGQLTLGGTPCTTSAAFSGILSGSNLTFTISHVM
jgi:hypothetical protein